MCSNTYYNVLQFNIYTPYKIWKNKILQKYKKILRPAFKISHLKYQTPQYMTPKYSLT